MPPIHDIVGKLTSTLFKLKVVLATFPLASVAVKVTTVVPTPVKVEPAAGDCVTTGAGEQPSAATTEGEAV